MPSTANFSQLPIVFQAQVLSFVDTERASVASKSCKEAATEAAFLSVGALKALPEDSFVSRLAGREVLEDTPEGQIELVKRTRKAAVEYLRENREELLQADIQELNLVVPNPRFAELSFTGMNAASDRIERNRKDLILFIAFTRILVTHPQILATLQLPPDDTPHTLAELLRAWIRDPAHQELRNAVVLLNTEGLKGIPIELLQLPNLSLDTLLPVAVANQQLDAVVAILNDPRPLDQINLHFALAHVNVFFPQVIEVFLRSPRQIDLNIILLKIILRDDRHLLNLALNSQHEIEPHSLGSLFQFTIEERRWDTARAILRSGRPIDVSAAFIGEMLVPSVTEDQWEIAQFLFENENPIDPIDLGHVLILAYQKGKYSFVQSILASNRPIDSLSLGNLLILVLVCKDANQAHDSILISILGGHRPIDSDQLTWALLTAFHEKGTKKYIRQILERNEPIAPERIGALLLFAQDHLALVAFILQTNRPIDSEWMGFAIHQALQSGNLRMARLLARSGRPISARYWGLCLIAASRNHPEIAREILKLPVINGTQVACATLAALAGLHLLITLLQRTT